MENLIGVNEKEYANLERADLSLEVDFSCPECGTEVYYSNEKQLYICSCGFESI